MDLISLVGVFLIGVVASFLGAMVGGGSLLSIPFLIFVGLPPQVAIATDRFGGLGGGITSLIRFWRAGKIVWKYVLPLSVLSLIGSLIGANLLVKVEPQLLELAIGILLLFLLPFVFFKKDIGTKKTRTSLVLLTLGYSIYLAVQTLTGFFGAGTGPLIFYTLMFFMGLTIIEAVATQIIPYLILSISSVVIFAQHGLINLPIGMTLLAGMVLGGYLGAGFALTRGAGWVKALFAVVVIASGIKLLFF